MNLALWLLLFYWGIGYIWLIIWSIQTRRKSLNDFKSGGDVAEAIIYAMTIFLGFFIITIVSYQNLKNGDFEEYKNGKKIC